MKKIILNKCMNLIRESSLNYTEERLEEIEYGLEGIYILITKSIIIFSLAYILGVFKELLIFMIIYNFIRMPSFGLHATKSSYCLISSLILFFLGMYISIMYKLSIYAKLIIGIYCIIRIYMNAPADTYKRPIVSKKRRKIYKFISAIIAILFVFGSLFIKNNFISNSLIITLFIQNLMISPYVYKLFKLPYNNYKQYIIDNGLNV